MLVSYLGAITIFGKGPTYISLGPIFWGEIVLAISLAWAFANRERVTLRGRRVRMLTFLICCFIVMGAIQTGIGYPSWGIDALRDSAVWYYSLFYFVGLVIASGNEKERLCSWWKLFFILSVPWAAEEVLTDRRLAAFTPDLGGHGYILGSAFLEIVQSMGLGCLLLLGENRKGKVFGTFPRIALAVGGVMVVGLYQGRGGKLAVIAAFMVAIALGIIQGSIGRSFRRKISLMVILLIAGAGAVAASGRNLIDTLSLNRFEGASFDSPDETAAWRTGWWANLYDGVMDRNPIAGLGFGENLSDYNTLLNDENIGEFPVRSPHNYNVTVFSRMGILGLLIWTGIASLGIVVPMWNLARPFKLSDRVEAMDRTFWIAAIIAIWVNSSFGVLMEGPVDGIPFWLILGLIAGQANSRTRSRGRFIPVNQVVSGGIDYSVPARRLSGIGKVPFLPDATVAEKAAFRS